MEKSFVEKSSVGDPLVMGVTVPLTMTKAKANEIALAWKECIVALYGVAKTKISEKPATNGAASSTATISA